MEAGGGFLRIEGDNQPPQNPLPKKGPNFNLQVTSSLPQLSPGTLKCRNAELKAQGKG